MEKDAKQLIDKYVNGLCTPEEAAVVERWYYNTDEQVEIDENRIDEIGERIWKEIPLGKSPVKKYRLWPRLAAAAAILIVGGAYLIQQYGGFGTPSANVYVNDIAPGKNKAVLTLDNGRTIDLSDAKKGLVIDTRGLTYEDGSSVAPQNEQVAGLKRLNLSTPRGGTYQVVLPDGSKVWLNASSTLSFPASFEKAESRRVELVGEAYFEITKLNSLASKAHVPFVVVSKGQEVEVLGTHFDVNCYEDESTVRTTLLEGSVKVSSAAHKSALLKPNQQSVLSTSNLTVKEIDADEVASWKDGYFRFNDESLVSIMQKVSRWYDVNVIYTDDQLKTETYAALTTRFANVSKLLDKLEQIGSAKFKIDGRTITISKK